MDNPMLSHWLAVAEAGTDPVINALQQSQDTLWFNPQRLPFAQVRDQLPLQLADIEDAAHRLQRFARYFEHAFPETAHHHGIIESPLQRASDAAAAVAEWLAVPAPENLLIKCDSHLPVAGSIKARGGFYEVLLYAETLALEHGLLSLSDDYRCFASDKFRALFSQHSVVVGSIGNLGLSIGILSAKLGFNVTVHMSSDARAWKKALLREKGVHVVEHPSDYSVAVTQGRQEALRTPRCHFVDDEDSTSLFLGYAVAALRLQQQLAALAIQVDDQHPLIVYLPCGVGGGPGGIAFGLKQVFGDAAHCYFAEPTHSPCMLLGMHTGLHNGISVQDIGLDNLTCADGLAVGRPSAFVGKIVEPLLDGIYTVSDEQLHALVALAYDSEGLGLEPSAVAGLPGFARLAQASAAQLSSVSLDQQLSNATHLVWATGGSLVPKTDMQAYYQQGKASLLSGHGGFTKPASN